MPQHSTPPRAPTGEPVVAVRALEDRFCANARPRRRPISTKGTTRMRHITVLAAAFLVACTSSNVTIAPPRVPEAGRAVSIAVNQSNKNNLIVATESGGLFRTYDGGKSFQHLDGFPTYSPVDVSFASSNPNIVIATAIDDFRAQSGGGIWRSLDGGASWSRPGGWPPAMSSTCVARPAARGISHMPLSTAFYIATDCGIAVSTDNGANFSMVVLDSTSPVVRSVLVVNRATGVAADDRRLWNLRTGSWTPVSGGPAGSSISIHALASPWWANASIFYFAANDRNIYFSTDAGVSWTQAETPIDSINREVFVRTARGLDGDPTHVDLYFGTGTNLYREAVTTVVPGGHRADWRPLATDHSDPADVAFSPGYEVPIMLATDGGVHITPDSGKHWKLTGSAYGGYNALQIGEITGRVVSNPTTHLELYYATQDNYFHGSFDGGHTWPGLIDGEGAYLSADDANPNHLASLVSLRQCGTQCVILLGNSQFNNTTNFPNPPADTSDRVGPPFELVGDAYLQSVVSPGPPISAKFLLTTSAGASWSPSFSLAFQPKGRLHFAGSLANPVAYIAVERPGSTIGLFRAANLAGQAVVRRADSTGLGSLGQLFTAQARHAVFAVDPRNADHLLAADAIDGKMKASSDGGITWYPLPALTTAVTDTGKFFGSDANLQRSFATTIAWDPANSCHILVGTMQNGVIRSADGGQTWSRVPGSATVTWISSFYFPPTGSIWMSAYGRSLWTLSVDRQPPSSGRCTFPPPPNGPIKPGPVIMSTANPRRPPRPFSGLNDSLVCADCTVIAAHNGRITDISLDGDRVTGIGISAGSIDERSRAGGEVPLSVANSYAPQETARLRRVLGDQSSDSRSLRALIVRGGQMIGLVLSQDELPLPASRTPLVYLTDAKGSATQSVVLIGDSVIVRGYGFLPGGGATGVDIVGADTISKGIGVRPNGTFSVSIPTTRNRPGVLEVSAIQRNARQLTIERGTIDIVTRDGRR